MVDGIMVVILMVILMATMIMVIILVIKIRYFVPAVSQTF